MVNKMARPEHMAGIGYHLMHLQRSTEAALLGNVYQHIMPHLSEEDANEFSVFYKEMLIGLDAEARERGAQPKTLTELREFIEGKTMPPTVKTICLTLVQLMEPPEPLEM